MDAIRQCTLLARRVYGLLFIAILSGPGHYALAQSTPPMRLITHLGGTCKINVTDGDFAYVATGGQLSIIDISDPNRLSIKGQIVLTRMISAMAVSQGMVYLMTIPNNYSDPFLEVVDARNPEQPVLRGSDGSILISASIDGFAAIDSRMFITFADQLLIIDASDPEHLSLRSKTYLVYEGHHYIDSIVPITADLIFVWGINCLLTVDVQDPEQPAIANVYNINYRVIDFTLSGTNLYITASNGLHIIDVSNPRNPFEAKLVQFDGGDAYQIAVSGGRGVATISQNYERFIYALDLTNPQDPVQGQQITQLRQTSLFDIAILGNRIFSAGDEGLRAVDATDPTIEIAVPPTLVGGEVHSMGGDQELLAVGTERSVLLFDMTDPSSPTLRLRIKEEWDCKKLEIADGRLYAHRFTDLDVFDLSNAGDPVKSARLYGIADFSLAGSNLYCAQSFNTNSLSNEPTGKLVLYDTTNLSLPPQLVYGGSDPCSAVCLDASGHPYPFFDSYYLTSWWDPHTGKTTYFYDYSHTYLVVLNEQNEKTASYRLSAQAKDPVIRDEWLFVLAPYLKAFNIADPLHPTLRGELYFPSGVMAIDRNLACVSHRHESGLGVGIGLKLISIANPTSPHPVSELPFTLAVQELRFVNGLIYVATREAGLYVYQYTGEQPRNAAQSWIYYSD